MVRMRVFVAHKHDGPIVGQQSGPRPVLSGITPVINGSLCALQHPGPIVPFAKLWGAVNVKPVIPSFKRSSKWSVLIIKSSCFLSAGVACALLLNYLAVGSLAMACLDSMFGIGKANAVGTTDPSPTTLPSRRFIGSQPNQTNFLPDPNRAATPPVPPNQKEQPKSIRGFTSHTEFDLAAYKTATEEIRERISQEQLLFALKFSIVGGILFALFSLSKTDQFEDFIQRRRTAVFFSAGILASVIIDIRLRFDIQMVEILGKWISTVEANLHVTAEAGFLPWELFLKDEMHFVGLPVMRCFSLSLTALLFLVTVYLFVVVPTGAYEGTRRIIRTTSAVFFIMLAFIGATYQQGSWRATSLIALAGFLLLLLALELKKNRAGVLEVVGPIISRLSLDVAVPRAGDSVQVTGNNEYQAKGSPADKDRVTALDIDKACAYLDWISRVSRTRDYLLAVAREVCAKSDEEGRRLLRERLQHSYLPADEVTAVCEIMDKVTCAALVSYLSGLVPKLGFLKRAQSSVIQKLSNLLRKDFREAEFAEDYLWKFYYDLQSSLREGGFSRYPFALSLSSPSIDAAQKGGGNVAPPSGAVANPA
jgi:hypothetical protein